MIIYHGHPSPNSIERCREVAPSHTHGAEWSPAKMTPHDWPYILITARSSPTRITNRGMWMRSLGDSRRLIRCPARRISSSCRMW